MGFLKKLSEIKNQVIFLALDLVFKKPVLILRAFMRTSLFSFLLLLLGLVLGFFYGARLFETGNYKILKGASVKVSGPCRVDGEIRKPSLAEDEVKLVAVTDEKIIGVVRATRETVECDISTTAIDSIPLLKDFNRSPAPIPEIKPFQPTRIDEELLDLRKRTIRASGTCESSEGQALPSFVDQDIEVISAERLLTDKSVIKISGIMRKGNVAVVCSSKSISYRLLDGQVSGPTVVLEKDKKKDLVGEIILITSTCFPDRRLPLSKKSKVVFYPLVNARLQVTQNTFDEDQKLSYVAGAIIENGAMVECDSSKYPISYRIYDPNGIRLEKINTAAPETTAEPKEEAPELKGDSAN